MGRKKRETPTVNASSMADIAFLLLTFFLAATSISQDKGIATTLPPMKNDEVKIEKKIEDKNLFKILINAQNQLLVEDMPTSLETLKERTKRFIMQEADNVNEAVVSIKSDRGTSYETYIEVYDQLNAAYKELWEEEALNTFNKSFGRLSEEEQVEIKTRIPFKISEAEQSNFGKEN